MVFDCHAHIASSMALPLQWYNGWRNNMINSLPGDPTEIEKKYLNQIFQFLSHDEDCSHLLRQMDEAGIDKTILLIVDFGVAYPDLPFTLEELCLLHKKVLESAPGRFKVFAGVDPRRGSAGLELFIRCVTEWGFSGLKLYPPCGFSPSDPILYPFYEICADQSLPVLTHIGPSTPSLRAKFAAPIEVDEAAWRFPMVNFIMAHGAITFSYECGLLASHRNNIFMDISGFQPLSNEKFEIILKELLEKGLQKKILFGTDWPIHFFSGSQKNAVNKMIRLRDKGVLSQADWENIMYKNIERLLK